MTAIAHPTSRGILGSRQDVASQARDRMTPTLVLVYAMWILLWYEPDWFVSGRDGGFLTHIPTLMLIPTIGTIALYGRREILYWPYLLFIAIHVVSLPLAHDSGLVMFGFKALYHLYFVFAVTVSVLDTPRKTVLLTKLFLLHFWWYGLQGIPDAQVSWHTVLGNEDSFGPLMVIGLGFSYYFATGTNSKRYRYLAALTVLLCMGGAVLSFARGAMLSLCLMLLVIWIRSPRKGTAIAYGLVASIVGLAVITIAFPEGEFWAEMETIGTLHTEGTGLRRWVFWEAAWKMFLDYPILGVGSWNFGPHLIRYVEWGALGRDFDPATLWDATVHNDYLQVLVEEGLLGVFAMGAMLVGFNNRLRFLRTEGARRRWHDATGGFIDLRNLSLGLEAAMIGYLANALFYGHLYFYWFWSFIAMAYVFAKVTGPYKGKV